MTVFEVAEEKQKIALADLIRLALIKEKQAQHLLFNHWDKLELNAVAYFQCFSQNEFTKVLQNYHIMSIKMLCNIFSTQAGIKFISDPDYAPTILSFCNFSLQSENAKV